MAPPNYDSLKTFMLEVKFFASVREQMGRDSLSLPLPKPDATVRDVWNAVLAQTGVRFDGVHLLAAVNMTHVPWDGPVRDGDEVAFFPPVTGG